jgi:predicted secreted hydrolase
VAPISFAPSAAGPAAFGGIGVKLRRLLVCLLILALSAPPATALTSQGTPVGSDAPIPVALPRDDGRHDSNVEWWYFTGHLFSERGERYGFEYVTFRARDGDLEGYVSHFAITDNPRQQFHYDQRLRGATGVAGDAAELDIDLDGWTMRGGAGRFALRADMPGYAMRLDVVTTKPAALHDGDGYIDYGNGAASYYYSWTRLEVTGALDLGQGWTQVSGEAWMDHQWGDFATYQDGGWDWFSVQLEEGTDVMLYLIRDADGKTLRVDGSIVSPDGELSVLGEGDFTIVVDGQWTSPGDGDDVSGGLDHRRSE